MAKQPIRPTTTQLKRILLEPLGGGVLLYHLSAGRVEVVEIKVDLETGTLTRADGEPLIFYNADYSTAYRLVREETKWIPVSERLPSTSRRVLVCDIGNIGIGFYSRTEAAWRTVAGRSTTVTYWMELPPRPGAWGDYDQETR